MGDCAVCYSLPGAQRYAGGYALQTPLSVSEPSYITQNAQTGIGGWNLARFDKAVKSAQPCRLTACLTIFFK